MSSVTDKPSSRQGHEGGGAPKRLEDEVARTPSTSSAAGSPVSPSPARVNVLDRMTLDGSGRTSHESFACYDPATSLLKTSQVCLDGEQQTYSETLPCSGTMLSGRLYRRVPLVRHTKETGCGSWPTPRVTTGGMIASKKQVGQVLRGEINERGAGACKLELSVEVVEARKLWPINLDYQTPLPNEKSPEYWERMAQYEKEHGITPEMKSGGQMWPTPVGDDTGARKEKYKQGGTALSTVIGGQLNPTWVEWLQGYPLGWTALDVSETP